MIKPLFTKREDADFRKSAVQLRFVQDTENFKDLIHKELSVNRSEQVLLETRIKMMKEFINSLPATDPQYNLMLIQIEMDQVELNELKIRHIELQNQFFEQ